VSKLYEHHLSRLNTRNDIQRRESLGHLSTALSNQGPGGSSIHFTTSVLPRLLPLILDSSDITRQQLLRILYSCPIQDIDDATAEKIVLYVQAGMTHLVPGIRASAMELLAWVLKSTGASMVSCPGGWFRILETFLAVFSWGIDVAQETQGWTTSNNGSQAEGGAQGKAFAKNLDTLALFLRAGLVEELDTEKDVNDEPNFLQRRQNMYTIRYGRGFAHLNLFDRLQDISSEIYMYRGERQQVFADKFKVAFENGLVAAKKQGGIVGRAAVVAQKVIIDGMVDYRSL
jgi:pre-rRNA-processing protein IPI1